MLGIWDLEGSACHPYSAAAVHGSKGLSAEAWLGKQVSKLRVSSGSGYSSRSWRGGGGAAPDVVQSTEWGSRDKERGQCPHAGTLGMEESQLSFAPAMCSDAFALCCFFSFSNGSQWKFSKTHKSRENSTMNPHGLIIQRQQSSTHQSSDF